jgi:signal transduction histidine kinase
MTRQALQAVLIAWTAVTVFSVAIAAFLYWRQRTRQYLAFGVLGAGSAAYTAAGARFYGAAHTAEAAFWMNVKFTAGAIAFVGVCLFSHELLRRPTQRVMRVLYLGAFVTMALIASGALVDPGMPTIPRLVLVEIGTLEARVTPAYYALAAFGVAALAYVVVQIARTSDQPTGRGVLVAAAALYGLGWIADSVARAIEIEAPTLTEHAVFASSLLVSYLLLDRFIQTATTLEQRTRELALRYDELRTVEAELVRKEQLAAVGELSAVIAHEVRNPLAVLRNAVSALRREELGEEDRVTLLEVLDEESNRLNRLVRDLLVYARPVEPQSVQIDLGRVLDRAIDMARKDHSRSAQIRVDVTMATDRTKLDGDPDLLERAFSNVAENALQAMPDGGLLTIHIEDAQLDDETPGVAIRFEDTGEGMDTLVRARARDPFFTTRPSGTGLGLAIVERVIKAHGGKVDLKSGDEDGTTVTLLMPLEARPPAAERGDPTERTGGRPKSDRP